ncbi:MAG: thiamine phosphate synthase [Betaproteobacteria bacterium]|nr:thiamine phosphate synthase [Betaproteobacteria bacterium]
MLKAHPIRGLYAITPAVGDEADYFPRIERALAGGVSLLQYRDKTADRASARRRALRLRQLCGRFCVPLIVNDDAELARETQAAGVHLGREDQDIARARALLGMDAIIGVSCYDRIERAREAQAQGANYVAFGSVFPSQVKPGAVRSSLKLIREARDEMRIPIVAIGGIDLGNAARVIEAGAHCIAVITALFSAPDTGELARAFAGLFSPVAHRG